MGLCYHPQTHNATSKYIKSLSNKNKKQRKCKAENFVSLQPLQLETSWRSKVLKTPVDR